MKIRTFTELSLSALLLATLIFRYRHHQGFTDKSSRRPPFKLRYTIHEIDGTSSPERRHYTKVSNTIMVAFVITRSHVAYYFNSQILM